MRRRLSGLGPVLFLVTLFYFGNLRTASAEFIVSSAILEFNKDTPTNQDIEIISHSKDNDYIATEVSEIVHPGLPDESRRIIEDPSQGELLVTPDKTILSGGGRKVIRFVLLKDLDDKEHIYRVKIQPVIRGLDGKDKKVGLKILIGYEILVIIRPTTITPNYTATRNGRVIDINNSGNSNVLFQNGKQCVTPDSCKPLTVVRSYAGSHQQVTLPGEGLVTYSVYDGTDTIEKPFP